MPEEDEDALTFDRKTKENVCLDQGYSWIYSFSKCLLCACHGVLTVHVGGHSKTDMAALFIDSRGKELSHKSNTHGQC